MTFGDILFSIFIQPLALIFEIIFTIAHRCIGHPGLAIVILSLAMNFLVLPLYKRADAMQEEARDIEAKLHDGVAHIKKTFKGDERMMILQAYYQENNYKPTDALKGSVSLLLEIPFFMAAYQFLSHLSILKGVSFGPIADLSAPDGLLSLGDFSVNLLPVLMTLINVISSAIYLKGFPLKTKIQLYAMAAFFLVFLYTSPSGLVFYWTLNNLFSLVKTIFYKLKNPAKVLSILAAVVGAVLLVFGIGIYNTNSILRRGFVIALGAALEIPLIYGYIKGMIRSTKESKEPVSNKGVFVLGTLFLAVLTGALIPSAVISASPQEFVDITHFHNPLWYVASALCLAVGTFLVWMRVFYWIASPRGKAILDKVVWIACGVALLNYMGFGTDKGLLSVQLQYEKEFYFEVGTHIINILAIAAVGAVMWFVLIRWKKVCSGILLTAVIALCGMSIINVSTINAAVSELETRAEEIAETQPHFYLNKNGKNVIVLMLDRGVGEYLPFIFDEDPELKEKFAGFTHYQNTISFGGHTNFGSPPLFGGYEYTPVEMNKRDDEPLASKHNEALKVMPVLFDNNNFDVTVCDPPYANYQWISDLSIYDEYPDIKAFVTEGAFDSVSSKEQTIENNYRNFFCFSIMKIAPVSLQHVLYNYGNYNQAGSNSVDQYSSQIIEGDAKASGLKGSFMKPYNVLDNLPNITKIGEVDTNTFMMMCNNTAHEPMLLQLPSYEPSYIVDNTKYNKDYFTDRTVGGSTLMISDMTHFIHYQANMVVLKRLGEWFDYMRESGVYDNTRIIIVSDHGYPLGQISELMTRDADDKYITLEHYYPLFMVKDFDSKEFTVSSEFMTNADVPTLATKDLIASPKNPFTGKDINSAEKTAHDQFVILSGHWSTETNNKNTYSASKWASMSGNLWDKNAWKFYNEVTVMPSAARYN